MDVRQNEWYFGVKQRADIAPFPLVETAIAHQKKVAYSTLLNLTRISKKCYKHV